MSYWGMAAGAVAGNVVSLLDRSDDRAVYDATYDAYMKRYTQMKNVMNQINVTELNITQLQQEKLMTDNMIRMAQDEAEAARKVSAATAGVQGSSVGQSITQTEMNKNLTLSKNRRNWENRKDQYVEQAKQLRYTMETIPQVRPLQKTNPYLKVLADVAPLLGAQEFGDAVAQAWDKGSELWSQDSDGWADRDGNTWDNNADLENLF